MNGDTTNSHYRCKVIQDTSTLSGAPILAIAYGTQTIPPIVRATVTVLGGYVLVEGQGLYNAQGVAFAFSFGDGSTALESLSVRATAGARAGCRLKVKRKL